MTHSLLAEARPLLEPDQLHTVRHIREHPSIVPTAAGVYGWWFTPELPEVPLEGTQQRAGLRLLYIGIAPRAPLIHRANRARTLRDRLKNHCRGPIASSTLRRTLACLLVADLSLQLTTSASGKLRMRKEDEARLTCWMDDNAQVAWLPHEQPWLLEDALISDGPRLPLNIRGSSDTFRKELKRMRASHR